MRTSAAPPWALILAGGDGIRLRALTAQIVGDARPKQFCPLFDGETLLDRTRRRADFVARFDHQVVVVTRAHEPYYGYLEGELGPGRLIVQPENRGTGPGILYPLLRVIELAGDDVPLVVLPSDHHVSDDLSFMAYVRSAVDVVCARPSAIVLLGVEPERPETEYGWIEPREMSLDLEGEPVFPIRRFWEKPSAKLAESLFGRGCLWNSFVMVARTRGLLDLIATYAPELPVAFDGVRRVMGTPAEAEAVDRLYAGLPASNFSDRILAQAPGHLATLRVKGVEWSDLGNPQRVLATVRRNGWRPEWLSRFPLASAG